MKRTDFVGLILAAACVVHCLAMPLVLVYLPVLGMSWLTDSRVHYALLGAGLTLGGLSFLPGYRVHRRVWIPALAAVGLGTMAYAAVYQEDQCCHRPPANSVAEIMQTSLVAREASQTGVQAVKGSHLNTKGDGLAYDSDLPERCRTGHCATKDESLSSRVSAGVAALGLTPYLPRSSTPVGATMLLIAHILNLKFRGFRDCTVNCCAEDEHSVPELTADANQVPASVHDTPAPSDETTR